MQNVIVFDIETIGDLQEWQKEELYASIKPGGNIKDPVKIQADIKKKFEARLDKAALDPWMARARVITACNLADVEEGCDLSKVVREWHSDTDEASVLEGFRDYLASLKGGYRVVGFNIARFDIPFLNVRMMKHGLSWRTPFPAHQRDYKRYFDLMTVLDGHKLDHWLKLFDIPSKIADGKDTLEMNIEDTLEYAVNEMYSMTSLVLRMSHCLNVQDIER